MATFRTDRNNNPCAFTTDLAKQAGLVLGKGYEFGDPFPPPDDKRLWTAKLLGDPILLSIRVIDAVGYYTRVGLTRWNYIAIPKWLWDVLSMDEKRRVIGEHYQHEGGTAMKKLFE